MSAFKLPFRGQTFKILQLTDIHYTDGDASDKKTLALITDLITEEKPDLIMLTGDFLVGEKNTEDAAAALLPVTRSGIPWCFVFGNHDAEFGKGHDDLLDVLFSLPNVIPFPEVLGIHGKSNYTIDLTDAGGQLKWVLFGMDSNMYNKNPAVANYDYIQFDQIAWYRKIMEQYEEKHSDFGALAFFHIPLPEYNEVWNTRTCYGYKKEQVCCPLQNSGLFSTMLDMGHMRGTFAGHDHINDYWGELYGIKLCYGRATGYHTYGRRGFPRGGRIILLDRENTRDFKTYVRLANGEVLEDFSVHQPNIKQKGKA